MYSYTEQDDYDTGDTGNQTIDLGDGFATFDYNTAGGSGGAIFMYSNADRDTGYQTIDLGDGETTFTGNTAVSSGGAIFMHSNADRDTGYQTIDLGTAITFSTNDLPTGAITMSDSDTDQLEITLAFDANFRTTPTLNIISNQSGDLYYIVRLASDAAPSETDLITDGILITGVVAERLTTVLLGNLGVNTAYKVYVVVADEFNPTTINSGVTEIFINEEENPPEEEIDEERSRSERGYYDQSLANILQLQLRIQNIKDISALNLDKSKERLSNITSSMQLSEVFIDLLVREHGIEKFRELVSISKNLNNIEFSLAFERIYAQSFASWYLQSAAPQIISEFELFSLSSSLSRIIELSTFQSFSAAEQTPTAQSQVLQKSIDKLQLDALIAYGGDTSLLAFLDVVDNQLDPSEYFTAFKSIYAYTFQDWYQQVGKFNLAKNLGISSFTAQLQSTAGLSKIKVSRN